jgi:hypothetical protein
MGWNFIQVVLHHTAEGAQEAIYDESFLITMRSWLDSPSFQGYVASAAIGILWCAADAVTGSKQPVSVEMSEPQAAPDPTPAKIRRSTPQRIR